MVVAEEFLHGVLRSPKFETLPRGEVATNSGCDPLRSVEWVEARLAAWRRQGFEKCRRAVGEKYRLPCRLAFVQHPPVSLDPRFAARERQPGLDLLRAVAVVFVVLYHAGNFGFTLPHDWQRFGWIGVDLFFVLSGYLIGGQLLGPLARGVTPNLKRFFRRRALRILPAYLVVLAIYFLFPSLREWPQIPPLWKFLAFVQNLDLHGGTAFSHAWSLSVEGQFYVVLPFLLVRIPRWSVIRIALPVAVIVFGLALRATLAYLHPGVSGVSPAAFQTLIYYPTITRLDPLVLGVCLAAIEKSRPGWWEILTASATWLWLPGIAAVIFGLFLGDDTITIASSTWQFPLIALGMAALLICSVSDHLPLRRVAVPGAAFLASVAYSIYLSHKLAIHLVIQLCDRRNLPLTSAAAMSLNLSVILLFGSVLFFAVERPFLQYRRRKEAVGPVSSDTNDQ